MNVIAQRAEVGGQEGTKVGYRESEVREKIQRSFEHK